jgi:galactose-1-phosphate uridylyltransferase
MTTHHLGPWGTIELYERVDGVRWTLQWSPLCGASEDVVVISSQSPTVEVAIETAQRIVDTLDASPPAG